MTKFLSLLIIAASLLAANSFAAVSTVNVSAYSYAGTNVTTSAYVTLVVASPFASSKLEVCDTSTKIIKIATGPVGSETDILTAPVSGCILIPYYILAGTRISAKAVDATATTGYNLLSFIP